MAFRVGQRVVCVDASETYLGATSGLKLHAIYTIANIASHDQWGEPGIDVAEVPAWEDCYHAPFFRSSRFRPIVERETDISALRALLVPGAKIRERA